MSNDVYSIEYNTLLGIADAVREKRGVSGLIPTLELRPEILKISSGGGEEPSIEDLTYLNTVSPTTSPNYVFAYNANSWIITNWGNKVKIGDSRVTPGGVNYLLYYSTNFKYSDNYRAMCNNNSTIDLLGNNYVYCLSLTHICGWLNGSGGVTSNFTYLPRLRKIECCGRNRPNTSVQYTLNFLSTGVVSTAILNNSNLVGLFPSEKRITDLSSYEALKEDEESWTTDVTYSGLNKTALENFITTLPDLSQYWTSGVKQNNIRLSPTSGSNTTEGGVQDISQEFKDLLDAKNWRITYS